MAPLTRYVLPSAKQLDTLSDEKVKAIVSLADIEGHRYFAYSVLGMICGTVSFLVCVTLFVYLVKINHDRAAGALLGATVMAIVGRMIRGK